MKKKIVSAIIIATLAVSMTACGNTSENSDKKDSVETIESNEEVVTETEIATEADDSVTSMTPEEIDNILSSITEETAELYGYCARTDGYTYIEDDNGNIIWKSEADVNDAKYYYKDHIMVIKGHGATEKKWQEIKGFDYEKEIEIVIIDEGITTIADCSFEDCYNLQYVHLPSTLGIIGSSAFKGCEKLNNVTFPDILFTIGHDAFYDCDSLTEVNLPDNAEILKHSFENCGNLQKVKLPQGITSYTSQTGFLGKGSFASCSKLSEVVLPDNLEYIHYSMFEWCYNIKKVTFNGVEYTDIQQLNMYLYENGLSSTEMTFPIKY